MFTIIVSFRSMYELDTDDFIYSAISTKKEGEVDGNE